MDEVFRYCDECGIIEFMQTDGCCAKKSKSCTFSNCPFTGRSRPNHYGRQWSATLMDVGEAEEASSSSGQKEGETSRPEQQLEDYRYCDVCGMNEECFMEEDDRYRYCEACRSRVYEENVTPSSTQLRTSRMNPASAKSIAYDTGSVFANVPVRTMASLPTMTSDDRAKMISKDRCPSPAAGIFEVDARGHPISWTERKPLAWYEEFLLEDRAASVVDFSPGSEAMARACLNQSVQYVGICSADSPSFVAGLERI